VLTKAARLRLFLARLTAAPAATGHDEALALIATVLNAVEDEHSGVPANPANWRTDGRMYPPQSDNARASADLPGVTSYRSVAHRTLIASNGALTIIELSTNAVLIEKAGGDGKRVPSAAK
jgi:hypothetical protein